ncbi:MAG: methyltransferase domain-containing protein [Gammaproteobacteria bacterium]
MGAGLIDTNHDERARERFVLALNGWVQTSLAGGSQQVCAAVVQPEPGLAAGRLSDAGRQALRRRMEREPLHQYWLAMMQIWQDLLWRYVGESVDRQLPALVAACRPRPGALGSLKLDPGLPVPRYQSAVDNHSLPGGYHAETCPDDVRQGAIYAQSANAYLLNRTGARHDYRGQTVIAHLLGRWPTLAAGDGPRRILDLGCLVGASTLAYAEQFPGAEIHAVDTAAPALRFAHGLAESRSLAVHYHQQNAERLAFPDGSFDVVVSHALLHETSRPAVSAILGECFRVLRPGGVTAHAEVPARVEVMSPWEQLRSGYEGWYNQEPFWNALTVLNLAELATAAGFTDAAQGFQQTATDGRRDAGQKRFMPVTDGTMDLGNWFVMSARKPGGDS